jgi:ribonucleotide reductase alpha subunit
LGYDIQKFGVANSLLTSCMPTASTAQIMGSTESFEPITSNIYTRSVLAGSFMVVNKYLQQDLLTLGIWNNDMKDKIIEQRGSLNNIDEIPDELKQLYKTTWDISNKKYIDMSKERAWFIDQTQSFNLFIAEPTYKNLTQCHMHGWKSGLKTGMYYLRRKPASDAIQFTIDKQKEQNTTSSVALEDRLHDNLEKAVNGEEIFTGSCTGGACGA